jgi:predicted transcriptional regulator
MATAMQSTRHRTHETDVDPAPDETRLERIGREVLGSLAAEPYDPDNSDRKYTDPHRVSCDPYCSVSEGDARRVLNILHYCGYVERTSIYPDGSRMAYYVQESWDCIEELNQFIKGPRGEVADLFAAHYRISDDSIDAVRDFLEKGPSTAAAITSATGINNGDVNRALNILKKYGVAIESKKGPYGASLWFTPEWENHAAKGLGLHPADSE